MTPAASKPSATACSPSQSLCWSWICELQSIRKPSSPTSPLSGPSYLAFVAAFAVLGLIWLSHHDLFSRLTGVNSSLLLRNLLLLFLVAFFSFPTAVLAAAFHGGGTRANQLVAIGGFNLTAIAITLSWVYLVRVPLRVPHLASDPEEVVLYAHRQAVYATIACAVLSAAFAIAFLLPIASIVVIALLPLINMRFYRRAQQPHSATQ